MSKSQKTVQTVCKVCKILAEISFVLLLVVAVLIVACGVYIGSDGFDKLLAEMTESEALVLEEMLQGADITKEYIAAMFVSLAITVLAEAVVAKFINVYFKHELKAGTPFTFEGAKEMLRLGIITIAVPAGASLAAAIYMSAATVGSGKWDISIEVSLGMGLVFLALSPLLKHGTELRLRAQYAEEKLAEEKPADSEEGNL